MSYKAYVYTYTHVYVLHISNLTRSKPLNMNINMYRIHMYTFVYVHRETLNCFWKCRWVTYVRYANCYTPSHHHHYHRHVMLNEKTLWKNAYRIYYHIIGIGSDCIALAMNTTIFFPLICFQLKLAYTHTYFLVAFSIVLCFGVDGYFFFHSRHMIMTMSIIIIVISLTLFLNDMLRNTERTNKWNDAAKMLRRMDGWVRETRERRRKVVNWKAIELYHGCCGVFIPCLLLFSLNHFNCVRAFFISASHCFVIQAWKQ